MYDMMITSNEDLMLPYELVTEDKIPPGTCYESVELPEWAEPTGLMPEIGAAARWQRPLYAV